MLRSKNIFSDQKKNPFISQRISRKACLHWKQICFWIIRKTQMRGWSKGRNRFGLLLNFRLAHIVFWKNNFMFSGLGFHRELLWTGTSCFLRGRCLVSLICPVVLPAVLESVEGKGSCIFFLIKWWNECVVIGCEIKVGKENSSNYIYIESFCRHFYP